MLLVGKSGEALVIELAPERPREQRDRRCVLDEQHLQIIAQLVLARIAAGAFSAKPSTPYGTGTLHDFMHAKVTVVDDTVFVGSFNLSHSGEQNAENVLELADAKLAAQLSAYADEVRRRYPPVTPTRSSTAAST